ncbi:MAG: hypothetical protein K0R58_2133 [Ramlibacter sp.]|jgi:hypothetical protein|nr:hypothetical protein [Ramlibacter sp.]
MAAAEGCRAAVAALRLPQLQRLLAGLSAQPLEATGLQTLSPPHERMLARAYGLPEQDGLIPFAALQAAQVGQAPGDAGCAWITPGHWRVGRDNIVLAAPQELQLDAGDSRAFLQAMQPYFAEDGIALTYDAPLRWLARGDIFRSLPTASLDRVVGRRIDDWMPAGEAGRPVRRLQQEMQMLLYTMPLNDERQRGGLLPVNSFWVSGTGALPGGYDVARAPGLQVSPYLRDSALQEDWAGWATAWQQLDAREGTRLAGELEKGREVRITLCGENGARTWTSAGSGGWRRWAARLRTPSVQSLLEGL